MLRVSNCLTDIEYFLGLSKKSAKISLFTMYFGIKNQKKTFFLAIRDVGAFIDNSFFGEKKYILHHPKEPVFFLYFETKVNSGNVN